MRSVFLLSLVLSGPVFSQGTTLQAAMADPNKKMKLKQFASACAHPEVFNSNTLQGMRPQAGAFSESEMENLAHEFQNKKLIGTYGFNIPCPAYIKFAPNEGRLEMQQCGFEKENAPLRCTPMLLSQTTTVPKKTWRLDEHSNCATDSHDKFVKGAINKERGTVILGVIPDYDSGAKRCNATILYKATMTPIGLSNTLQTFPLYTDTAELDVSWSDLVHNKKTKQRFFNYCAIRSLVLDLQKNGDAALTRHLPLVNVDSNKMKMCTWFAMNPQSPFGPGRIISFEAHYLNLPNEFQQTLKEGLLSVGRIFQPTIIMEGNLLTPTPKPAAPTPK